MKRLGGRCYLGVRKWRAADPRGEGRGGKEEGKWRKRRRGEGKS